MQDAKTQMLIPVDYRAWLQVWAAVFRVAAGALLAFTCHTLVSLGQERQQQGQTSLQAGDINTDFSRVYIFVDRTTALGHAH